MTFVTPSLRSTAPFLLAAAVIAMGLSPPASAQPPTCDGWQEGDQECWRLVLLPDTQVYSQSYPEVFQAQTRWIALNHQRLNIKYVLHEGDITNTSSHAEWQNASDAMAILDRTGVPYALAPGNHDFGPGGNGSDRTTLLNDYFPLSRFQSWPTFGSAFEPGKTDNTYHRFQAGGESWLILALEFGPRDEVVDWADDVVAAHPEHRVILVTHAYLYYDGTRYDIATRPDQRWNPHYYGMASLPGGVNDGEEIWRKLVDKHPGFALVVNGHVLGDGVARLASSGSGGQTVHQMLANYQSGVSHGYPRGGNGYLRILDFLGDGHTVRVWTYSPYAGEPLRDVHNEFALRPLGAGHLAGVPAANFAVNGAGDGAIVTVPQQSGGWGVAQNNNGDIEPVIHLWGPTLNDGVMMATIREDGRDHGAGLIHGSVEAVHDGAYSTSSTFSVSTCEAGRTSVGAIREFNIDVAMSFFPYADGWQGGHVKVLGTTVGDGFALLTASAGIDASFITSFADGRFTLGLPQVHSLQDGMLFVIGGSNEDNVVTAAPFDDGGGWEIATRDSGYDFPSFEHEDWSFLYLPYATPNLIGGRIMADGSVFASAGSFAITRTGTGTYQLGIPGESPETGMLLLSVAGFRTTSVTAPDDNLLVHEPSGDDFVIRSRDFIDLGLQDTDFVFAFVSFRHSLGPEPVLEVADMAAGQTALLSVMNATPGAAVLPGLSLSGGGPIASSWGTIWLSPPFVLLPPLIAGPDGTATLHLAIPPGTTGLPIWFQAFDTSAQKLSSDLFVTVR